MQEFNVTAELDLMATRRNMGRVDEWAEGLSVVHGVLVNEGGRLAVVCTVDAESLALAVAAALATVTRVTGRHVVAVVEAMLTDEFDRRGVEAGDAFRAKAEQAALIPELVSAAEAGQILNVGAQRVRELVADGRLVAQSVGERHTVVVSKASAEQLKAAGPRKPGRPRTAARDV